MCSQCGRAVHEDEAVVADGSVFCPKCSRATSPAVVPYASIASTGDGKRDGLRVLLIVGPIVALLLAVAAGAWLYHARVAAAERRAAVEARERAALIAETLRQRT